MLCKILLWTVWLSNIVYNLNMHDMLCKILLWTVCLSNIVYNHNMQVMLCKIPLWTVCLGNIVYNHNMQIMFFTIAVQQREKKGEKQKVLGYTRLFVENGYLKSTQHREDVVHKQFFKFTAYSFSAAFSCISYFTFMFKRNGGY